MRIPRQIGSFRTVTVSLIFPKSAGQRTIVMFIIVH